MADIGPPAATMIDQQVKELDAIAKRAVQDFNTTLGAERMGHWKTRTVALLQQHAGQKEADELARKNPGIAFTNDLIEEFTDEVECYRSFLVTLAKRLRTAAPPAAG
ncbi:MAG: hypothetical protein R3B37_15715 [Nitrospira sp.]|nr:hypothetical protein [Nitrospira sp.]